VVARQLPLPLLRDSGKCAKTFPIIDTVADGVIDKYEQSLCPQPHAADYAGQTAVVELDWS